MGGKVSGTHQALLLQLTEKFVKVAERGKFSAYLRGIRRQSFGKYIERKESS